VAKGIVVYYSRSGNTKEMAQIIAKAMNDAELPTESASPTKESKANVSAEAEELQN